jgi:hypothetical protein
VAPDAGTSITIYGRVAVLEALADAGVEVEAVLLTARRAASSPRRSSRQPPGGASS